MYLGEAKTLTAIVRADLGVTEVSSSVEPGGVVELIDGSITKLSQHRRRKDVLVAQIRLHPLIEEETLLTVSAGAHSAVAIVNVEPQREIVEVEIPAPETLTFERANYRIQWNKKKRVVILAPLELVDSHGPKVQVASTNAGVVVRGETVLQLDEDGEFYKGDITLEGRTLGAQSTVTARLGSLIATCKAVVTRDEEGPKIKIEIEPELAGTHRAIVEQHGDHTLIKVMGFHPRLSGISVQHQSSRYRICRSVRQFSRRSSPNKPPAL